MKNKIIFTLLTPFIKPNKGVVITFVVNRNLKRLKEPTLFNKMIQLTSEVKYPGLMLVMEETAKECNQQSL
jgi:hypothetical protein